MKQIGQIEEYHHQIQRFTEEMEKLGLEQDMLFKTALDRYMVQVDVLNRLKIEIDKHDATVEREYVKGAASVYVNPLISEFNKTASAANQTCNLLVKQIEAARKRADEFGDDDEL